ncbi:urease accessory UreF family protein [Bosea sp. Leaf344]|uniref:urease accessory protein UreF n=1 Tax=Bosea sp. Leaf344 TaxID=1736346 RepID=UPI000A643603|nr:urease accessory UreF family protein [Bosea sp. Leaf344]
MSAYPLPLMVWLSPSFPVGAFAYSHGLEWAFDCGDVTDAAGLHDWLLALVEQGSLRNDLILFVSAFRAAVAGDLAALGEVAELAVAMANSAERRLETVTQGNAFVIAAKASWPCAGFEALAAAWAGDVAYPVAVAVAAAGHDLPLPASLDAYGLAFVANLVSASVRLGIVGQTDGQRVIAQLVPALHRAAAAAAGLTLDDLGGCAFRSDLAALRHETQYSRLFRS